MLITTEIKQSAAIVELDGRLDIHSTEDFRKRITELIEQGIQRIIIDCNKLSFISSAGLRVLIVAQGDLEPKQGEIVFFGFNSNTRKIFDITGYCNLFLIFDNRMSALDYFGLV